MSDLQYLLKKIEDAPFEVEPFRHVYLENFFSDEDFSHVLQAPEVCLPPVQTDEALITALYEKSFKEIVFPGTTTDVQSYLKWHKNPSKTKNTNVDTCEGFGLTLRLERTQEDSTLRKLEDFFKSPVFFETLARKFGISLDEVYGDQGLQKYLDGYEISPHPDTRKKALTYMININPDPDAERLNFHTHYLRLKPERSYVQTYWEHHPLMDRCWVPWSWCDTIKQQTKNNSLVIFAPSDNTLHAIKASYDHLKTQRTQFYGNLWYHKNKTTGKPNWRDFEIVPTPEQRNGPSWGQALSRWFPTLMDRRKEHVATHSKK